MFKLGGPIAWLGIALDLAGIGLIVLGATGGDQNRVALIGGGIILSIIGIAFVLAGRLTTSLVAAPVNDPVEAVGVIVSVRDGGVTIGESEAMFVVTVSVQRPGTVPYDAEFGTMLRRPEWAQFVPGARVPILVERLEPGRVERDRSRSIEGPR